MTRSFSFLLTILLVGTLLATNYKPAEGYAIEFATQKAEGTFQGLEGTIAFDANNLPASKFDVWVDAASVQTGNKMKDKHARGNSWLDSEQFPRISFRSDKFERVGDAFRVTGQLTIRGVSKEVVIPFDFKEKVFTGTTTVLREDFGIDGPFLFGGMVGEEIAVSLRVPVTE